MVIGKIKKSNYIESLVKESFKEASNEKYFYNLAINFKTLSNLSWNILLLLNNVIFKIFGFSIFKNKLFSKLYTKKVIYEQWKKSCAIKMIYNVIKFPEKYDEIYKILADDNSKKIFSWLIKYRIAYGLRGEIADEIYPLSDFFIVDKKQKIVKSGKYYKLNGYSIDSTIEEIKSAWDRENYTLDGICLPESNDIVISAGGFYGETAIWFADKIGPMGKVYSFEPSNENFIKLKKNIKINNLEDLIIPVKLGLWHEDTTLFFNQDKECSHCTDNTGIDKIDVITIDSFVSINNLARVDFIKMDIERAEINALKGAINTIKRFRPKLAICAYHLADDIINIPELILSFVPEYKIYFSQKKQDWVETVIFAI